MVKIDSAGNVPLGYIEPFTALSVIPIKTSSLSVFPNPTSGELTVLLEVPHRPGQRYDLVVTDLLGRVVKKRMIDPSQTRITLSLSDLSDGCYLLHVAGNGLSNESVMIMLKR